MQEQEPRRYFQLPSLSRSHFIEVQPCIKNAHTATHMEILNNKLAFMTIQQSLHVYSLIKMAESQASLINIISLKSIFQPFAKEHYEDMITSIFRKAEKQDFSSQIFNEDQNPRSNILLSIDHLKGRINFFNNSSIRVKSFEVQEENSNILIVLQDGRAAVLSHPAHSWTNQKIESVNLNEVTHQKIHQACFISKDLVCLCLQTRILVFSLKEQSKINNHKIPVLNISQLKGTVVEKDKLRVLMVCQQEVVVCQMNKKKMNIGHRIKIDSFINSIFLFKDQIFVNTHDKIIKINCFNLEKQIVHEFSEPSDVSHMDQFGNFSKIKLNNNRQSLKLMAATTNGVFIGLTIRKNGNYKQGRLVVFQCPLTYYIQKLLSNIGLKNYIDTSDSIFIPKSKENKELLQEFAALYKKSPLIYNKIPLIPEDYNIASINLGHAFQGKEIAKTKIIQKTLRSRFQSLFPAKKRLEYNEILQRCMFSGTVIFDEEVVHCKDCDLFGIEGKGDRCIVCYRKMAHYQ